MASSMAQPKVNVLVTEVMMPEAPADKYFAATWHTNNEQRIAEGVKTKATTRTKTEALIVLQMRTTSTSKLQQQYQNINTSHLQCVVGKRAGMTWLGQQTGKGLRGTRQQQESFELPPALTCSRRSNNTNNNNYYHHHHQHWWTSFWMSTTPPPLLPPSSSSSPSPSPLLSTSTSPPPRGRKLILRRLNRCYLTALDVSAVMTVWPIWLLLTLGLQMMMSTMSPHCMLVLAAQRDLSRLKDMKDTLTNRANVIGHIHNNNINSNIDVDQNTAVGGGAVADRSRGSAVHQNFQIGNSTIIDVSYSTSNNNNNNSTVRPTTTAILVAHNIHSHNHNNMIVKSVGGGSNAINIGINHNAIEMDETQTTPVLLQQPVHIGDGPYFDATASKNVTALLGKTAYLNCRVKNLGNRTMLIQVSWVRHRDIHLLTVGRYTYTSDQRFRAIHQPQTDDWILQIKYPQHRDSGIYECQVSTTPHLSHYIHLNVVEPATEIIGAPDLYIESGSTINLTCVILNSPEPPAYIFWNHNNEIINYDSPRGGVSVVTNKGETTTSFLLIKTARPSDSGLYQCNPSNAKARSVTVHVLNGEFPAAMQHAVALLSHRMSIMQSLIICCLALYYSKHLSAFNLTMHSK